MVFFFTLIIYFFNIGDVLIYMSLNSCFFLKNMLQFLKFIHCILQKGDAGQDLFCFAFWNMEFRKFFTLSYDDGVEQDKRLIELIKKYGLSCTFNINSGFFGRKNMLNRFGVDIRHDKIPENEFAQVYDGFEIATHAVNHPDLRKLTDEEIIEEIVNDRKNLSALAGYDVVGHAYPGGVYDERVADCLKNKCGIRYARTVDSTGKFEIPDNLLMWHPTCHHSDEKVFDLIDSFVNDKEDDIKLFYLWGHSYEFDCDVPGNSWEQIEKIFQRIAGKSDICYCTNSEFLYAVNL